MTFVWMRAVGKPRIETALSRKTGLESVSGPFCARLNLAS